MDNSGESDSDISDGEQEDGLDFFNEVERLLNLSHTFEGIAISFGVHRNTLRRWMQKVGADGWEGRFAQVSIDDVVAAITEWVALPRHGSNWGIKHVQSALWRHGLRVSRMSVRAALWVLQPEQMQVRKRGVLLRRAYDITVPTHMWHIDSYDKLAPWGIRIHGGIDGASQYILWLEVSTNKLTVTTANNKPDLSYTCNS